MMAYKLIISPGATQDIFEAFEYYQKKEAGLGNRFLNELEDFYKKLKKNPTFYSFVSKEKSIRALSLKVFPYKIIYEINQNELYVFAIHHFSQSSNHFLKRL